MLNLDINKEITGRHIVYGRVGDNNSHIEKVSVINSDGTPFNLTGISICFMGNTHQNQTKVIDSDGVKIVDAAKGLFQYTFPSMAFGVAGPYERAYFQFTNKDGVITSTGDFEVIVLDNTDITSNEAETIITEYNKLVKELQELQKKTIAELKKQQENHLKELYAQCSDLQHDLSLLWNKVDSYEKSVQKTATDAKSTISDAVAEAIETIAKALEEFQNKNFYTKREADDRFAKKTDLTKENVQLGNVDNYKTANQTDAEQGFAGNKFITPMGVKQHVDSRMATQEEVDEGEAIDKIVSPKTLADLLRLKMPLKMYWGPGSTLNDSNLNARLTFGDLIGIDPFHKSSDIPFTINSGKYEATMTRDADLFFDINLRLQGGGASTVYSDYYYIQLEYGSQTGGSGESKKDFAMIGANNGQRLNLSNTLTGKAIVSLKKGQKFAITATGLRSGQKIFSWQFLSGTIEEYILT